MHETAYNNVYYADLSECHSYSKMIFVRMDPAKSLTDNWDAKWNQSEDVTLTGKFGYTFTASSGWTPSCTDDSTVKAIKTITFTVNYNTNNNGDLYIRGNFNSWDWNDKMNWSSGNNWSKSLVLITGKTIEYKLVRSYSGGGYTEELNDKDCRSLSVTDSTTTTQSLSWEN